MDEIDGMEIFLALFLIFLLDLSDRKMKLQKTDLLGT